MTKKHRIFFILYKFYAWLIGIKSGKNVFIYSKDKNKLIKGVVSSIGGESVTKSIFGFDVNINWNEPLTGEDPRYHSYGSYKFKDVRLMYIN